MFERFTERARRAVVLAQEEARSLNHNYIGTEHILLGLIDESDGLAAIALGRHRIEQASLRSHVVAIVGQGEQSPSGHVPFTPRAKEILEASLRESRQLGHNYIGTEHILLALIDEGEGVGAQVLLAAGANLTDIRDTVVDLLSGVKPEHQGNADPSGPRPGSRQSVQIDGLRHRSPIPAASRIGPFLTSSIIVGLDPATGELPGSTEEQISNVFGHIGAILAQAGAGWDDIAEVTFAMIDLEERGLIGPPWLEHFPDENSRPAREVQQRSGLAGGARITARFTAYLSQ
ncbi:MAG: hypothetical protein KJO36_00175 [Acidimicrobiia bacterium]|nr:hypothetical protein [Acidimicrobiia bacterium]NNL47101.1 hypothetical protein [Acidimicrobiia bacterium]